MPTPFLSSEEYDERAHQLYNEGQYDEALDVLREGLSLYPNAVELHIGVGYARVAREEYAWARRSFEEALILDPDHEDALAGLGEVLLKFGQPDAAVKRFRRVLELGYQDDVDLMLQSGRALFREGLIDEAKEFFEIAVQQSPESAEAVACVGYAQHRLADDEGAIATLRRALQLDSDHTEARIYLGNVLYDRGEYEAALYHLDRTTPEDHWDELGIWRLVELKKTVYRLKDDDPELKPWDERLTELAGEPDDIDEMLAEIEQKAADAESAEAKGQLELFGALLTDLAGSKREDDDGTTESATLRDDDGSSARDETSPTAAAASASAPARTTHHRIVREGRVYNGTWEEIVRGMRDENAAYAGRSLSDFMMTEARRGFSITGVEIPTGDAESFIRGSADAGLLRILR
ncbi:MAG TPA: tetratricopeptide repeat protein [Gemmatimonadaceae bacterium]|nr:tetratricopeptide repeat protein [Gemmatimonadaceae bacterium]